MAGGSQGEARSVRNSLIRGSCSRLLCSNPASLTDKLFDAAASPPFLNTKFTFFSAVV